jgi:hypothetical protein
LGSWLLSRYPVTSLQIPKQLAPRVVARQVDQKPEHTDHEAGDIDDFEAVLEDPGLAIDEDQPPEAHQGTQVVPVPLGLLLQLLEVQLLKHTLELVVECQDEAEPFYELVDLGFELAVLQMDLADDVLEEEHELVQVVVAFQGLGEAQTHAPDFFALNYPPITRTLYITCDFSLRKNAHRMATCTLSYESVCSLLYWVRSERTSHNTALYSR